MNFLNERLIRKAHAALASDGTIPLDLFADLLDAGIDVTELERNYRNG